MFIFVDVVNNYLLCQAAKLKIGYQGVFTKICGHRVGHRVGHILEAQVC